MCNESNENLHTVALLTTEANLVVKTLSGSEDEITSVASFVTH